MSSIASIIERWLIIIMLGLNRAAYQQTPANGLCDGTVKQSTLNNLLTHAFLKSTSAASRRYCRGRPGTMRPKAGRKHPRSSSLHISLPESYFVSHNFLTCPPVTDTGNDAFVLPVIGAGIVYFSDEPLQSSLAGGKTFSFCPQQRSNQPKPAGSNTQGFSSAVLNKVGVNAS